MDDGVDRAVTNSSARMSALLSSWLLCKEIILVMVEIESVQLLV
jgi:hypothetical protein